MKLAIDSEQRQYFRKNHSIEFELLKQDQLEEINQSLDRALASRLHVSIQQLLREPPEKTFSVGYDLWRDDAILKKYVTNRSFAEIASELIEYKPLRLAYDQFYPTLSDPSPFYQSGPYRSLIMQPRSLKEISCIQGLLCGLVICLSGEESSERKAEGVFPSRAGNGTFFTVEAVLDFHELLQNKPHRYLLITYTHATSIYVLEEKDPHTHDLKRLGYVFGDKLADKFHPFVYR